MQEKHAKHIKGIVDGVLGSWKKEKVFKKDIIEKAWGKVAGKKAAKHTRVSSLRSGRLIIEVNESGWIYQLTLKKQEIIGKLKKALKGKDIDLTEVQFRIGSFN